MGRRAATTTLRPRTAFTSPTNTPRLAELRAAAAERFTCQTLAGIGHAQSTMDKYFELDRRLRMNRADFGNRKLAGQHHALDSQFLGDSDTLTTRERHLCRRVDFEIGT